MSVSITFQSSNGGSTISDPLSHGNISNGAITTPQIIFLSQNGVNPVTGVGFYIDLASPYTGDATALGDQTELISWGNGVVSSDFGGFQINQNATGSFPGASWPTLSNPTTTDTHGITIRTGHGDSSSNPIPIQTVTGASSTGTIQTGASPNVSFATRIVVPSNVSVLGARAFKFTISYTYTS